MRSAGIVCDRDGNIKSSWRWADPTRPSSEQHQVEDGDEIILLEPDHPAVKSLPVIGDIMHRNELIALVPEAARSHHVISLPPIGPLQEHVIRPADMTVQIRTLREDPKGGPPRPDATSAVHSPAARLIRVAGTSDRVREERP